MTIHLELSKEEIKVLFKQHLVQYKVAAALGISHPSLQKLIKAKFGDMSGHFLKKQLGIQKPISKQSTVKILLARELYLSLGSLDAAGKAMKLTRERVRQLIVYGNKRGLIKQKTDAETHLLARAEHYGVTKEKIETQIKEGATLTSIAAGFKMSTEILGAFLRYYELRNFDRAEIKLKKILADYRAICEKLGRHPSTGELYDPYSYMRGNKKQPYRYIAVYIYHHFGSFKKFRKKFFPDVNFENYHPSPYCRSPHALSILPYKAPVG